MSERIIRHHSLPVSAPESFWRSMGWQTYVNSDEAGERAYCHNANALLAVAVANGLDGIQALAYVVSESQRQNEEKTRSTALAREAEAIKLLADAIKGESESALLSRLMSRLSDKTQWALREQLAGTGLLPKG